LIKNLCGYMPQTISFLEGTVAENIAFGVEKKLIDFTKVKECLAQSEISYFLNQENFLTSDIKEKGHNFSGGEKQRLALARTLYHDPEIIILDESTSAMDEELEDKILQTIKNLKDKTVIFITHKKKNLKLCDKVISLDRKISENKKSF
jgi:ABC-type bacteriocin/lantibiotic exporter with double-glycine peptidase domain